MSRAGLVSETSPSPRCGVSERWECGTEVEAETTTAHRHPRTPTSPSVDTSDSIGHRIRPCPRPSRLVWCPPAEGALRSLLLLAQGRLRVDEASMLPVGPASVAVQYGSFSLLGGAGPRPSRRAASTSSRSEGTLRREAMDARCQ